MTKDHSTSHQGILKVMSFLASTSAVSVVFGLIRMKVAALLLGPVGVGVISLLQNALGLATTVGDMGMRQSGARQISKLRSAGDADELMLVRQTLMWMAVALAALVAAPFIIFRSQIASTLLGQAELSGEVAWLAVPISATVLAAAMTAILNGYQRVREIGRITVISAAVSTVVSVVALWIWRENGIPLVIASAPTALFLVSLAYVAKIGALPRWTWPSQAHLLISHRLVRLGVFVMLSAIALSLGEFSVRLTVQHAMGSTQVGLFAAAWTIGVYYLNFLMVATSTEFYPRLCTQIDDVESTNRAINVQLQTMAAASAPVVIASTAFGPWLLTLLYSHAFVEAAPLMRLMAIGDVFRLAIYPLGFALLAAERGRTFFSLKLTEAICLAGLSALLLPYLGLVGVGLAQVATFTILFILYHFALRRGLQFRLERRTLFATAALLALAIALSGLAIVNLWLAAAFGSIALVGWAIVMLHLHRLLGTKKST